MRSVAEGYRSFRTMATGGPYSRLPDYDTRTDNRLGHHIRGLLCVESRMGRCSLRSQNPCGTDLFARDTLCRSV